MTRIILLILLLASIPTQASCISGWNAQNFNIHKPMHFAGAIATTMAATYITDNPSYGLVIGLVPSVARELYKMNNGGRCEWSSMGFDLAGALLGQYLSKEWLIQSSGEDINLTYTRRF